MKITFALLAAMFADAETVSRHRRDLISWNRNRNNLRNHRTYRRYDQMIINRVDEQMYLVELSHHVLQSKNMTSFHSRYVHSLIF